MIFNPEHFDVTISNETKDVGTQTSVKTVADRICTLFKVGCEDPVVDMGISNTSVEEASYSPDT